MFPILEAPLMSSSAVFQIKADIWHVYLRICLEDEPIHHRLHPSLLRPTKLSQKTTWIQQQTYRRRFLSLYLPLKTFFYKKTPLKSVIIQVSHAPIPTAAKATNNLLPCWRNAPRALDQSEGEKWQVLDQSDSEEGRGEAEEEFRQYALM